MKSWITAAGWPALSLLIPAGLALWKPSWETSLLLAAWAAAAMAAAVLLCRGRLQEELRRQEHCLQEQAIRTLNHHRHDWMNDLQVLYGYIQLGKPDKSVQCVERIKERIALDSRIAKLGIPPLVFFLQSYRTSGGGLLLDIEVEEGLCLEDRLSPEGSAELASAVAQTVAAYERGLPGVLGEPPVLELSFRSEGPDLIIVFEGEDPEGNPDLLQRRISSIIRDKRIRAERLDPQESDFQLRIPMGV
ncbi:Spo0B domain-containing protein [Paenibacillus glufosinatiresistens]|uniref:Spo0B domain-containing protein n=1 Tax=Paenibacillus glufosinatiresistens TaxID=3070657 RepID=UPI00286E6C6E|nr:Spo0B domain-containing protein [Paenibacillus sp. YX.27]